MTRRGAAILLALVLLSGCAFTRKHPRATLVSATTAIFSAGIGAPLSLDCDNTTSTCSGRHVAAVFGIGAAIGFGIGLLAVHELGIGEPRELPPTRAPDVSLMTCNEARREIVPAIESACDGRLELWAAQSECICRRPVGAATFECVLDRFGTCHPKSGDDIVINGTCKCAAASGAANGCTCSAVTSTSGGVP